MLLAIKGIEKNCTFCSDNFYAETESIGFKAFFCGYNLLCFVLLFAKKHGSEMQCTNVTYLLPGQGNGFIMCAQSFENIDAIENRGSTKCYNFYVLENWHREGDTKDDRSTACESFYFIYGKDYYNVSYKDSWVLNGLGEPAVKKKRKCFSRTK